MVLSYEKLELLLNNNGVVIKKIFSMNQECVMLEVLCIINANCFIIYIPSKYSIPVPDLENVFDLDYFDLDKDENIAMEYGENPDDLDLEKNYESINLQNDHITENKLNDNYNHPLSLTNNKYKEIKNVKEVVRQLNRLKFCTKNLKYNLSIIFKNYICTIKTDNNINVFIIDSYNINNENKNLLVTIDLNNFYKKIDTFLDDIITIRDGIYKILNKNHTNNLKNLKKLLKTEKKLTIFSEKISEKKKKYNSDLLEFEKLLKKLYKKEKNIITKINDLHEKNDKNNDVSIKGIHTDTEYLHKVNELEKILENVYNIKQDLITEILETKEKIENLTLNTDSILFDNLIMINTIFKNYELLENNI